jgi:hypothetical protein
MATTYHRAECTDGGLRLCSHVHATLVSAVACLSSAGEFIVAKENGFFRALTNVEQMEYKHAVYGRAIDRSIAPIEGCRKKRFT